MSFTRSRRPRQRASNIYIFTKMTFALKMYKINKECEVIDNHAKYSFDQAWFLFGWAGSLSIFQAVDTAGKRCFS